MGQLPGIDSATRPGEPAQSQAKLDSESKGKTWVLTLAVVVFSVVVVAGFLVLVLWMISELALLSRADLSFVLPVTSAAYVLIAVVGHFVLQERISGTRWAGIAVITLGVIMVAETPARTTPEPPPEGHHR
jgi:drug/metabolite transporter (DMT)-like permease